MHPRVRLAAASRDGHQTLRRVERQHALIERLYAVRGQRIQIQQLARDLGVSMRTIARDVDRLRLSGVPLSVRQGNGGGVSLEPTSTTVLLKLDLPEAAALMASLAALGPSVSDSATSAMRKLTQALHPDTLTTRSRP